MLALLPRSLCFTSLQHRSGSILTQVMPYWLTARSQYLYQCWLIINVVMSYSPETNVTCEITSTSIRGQWVEKLKPWLSSGHGEDRTVYHMKYSQVLVLFIFRFLDDPRYSFIHIVQGWFTFTGGIIWLFQFCWWNPYWTCVKGTTTKLQELTNRVCNTWTRMYMLIFFLRGRGVGGWL